MICALVASKGGVGKTVSAMFLAEAINRKGRTVAVWDTDPQGSAISWADISEENGTPLAFPVEGIHPKRITAATADAFDGHIVIDTPPGDIAIMRRVVDLADLVVVVTGTGRDEIERAVAVMSDLEDKASVILLNRYDKRHMDAVEVARSLKLSDLPVFATPIPARVAIARAYGAEFPSDLYGFDRILGEIDMIMAAIEEV